ncbi:MAG: DUF4382 domain-containing protein [Bacteroidota bacterium]
MKTKASILAGIFALFLGFTACEDEDKDGTGTMNLELTDAPVDNPDITGVWVTIKGLEYHKQNNDWETFDEYEGPKEVNLLELTDSMTEMLGSFEMEAGQYNQLRFILDAPVRGESTPSNPGSYLEYSDGETESLFVPSGGESGYKAVGSFTVPVNGSVDITADFDARKSVVKSGASGIYILKPTIRLTVDNEAGTIAGNITNIPSEGELVVYAYEDDTYDESEAADPDDEEARFPNAVTSNVVEDEGEYKLWYLAPMTYDLVVAHQIDGEFQEVVGTAEDITVESNKTATENIEL